MKCIHCDMDFEPKEKYIQAKNLGLPVGKINECLDCAEEEEERYTGVMVYGHKTGGEIQINTDPKITAYMKSAGGAKYARSLGKTSLNDMPSTRGGVKKVLKDVAKRR